MPPRSRNQRIKLEDSWVDGGESNGHDDPDYEWEKQTDSDSEYDSSPGRIASPASNRAAVTTPTPPSQPRQPFSQQQYDSNAQRSSGIATHITVPQDQGPELVYPSIHEDSPPKFRVIGNEVPARQGAQQRATYNKRPRRRPANSKSGATQHIRNQESFILVRMLSWIYDVMVGSLDIMKTPLGYLLAYSLLAYICIGVCIYVTNAILHPFYGTVNMACSLPFVSRLSLCSGLHNVSESEPSHPIDSQFSEALALSTKFEDVLSASTNTISLPLDMKRSEASIRNLRQVVRYSTLASKNELDHEFENFIKMAQDASYDLQRFNSHVGRSVDSLLASARWTSRMLDDANNNPDSPGLIAMLTAKIFFPFQLRSLSRTESTIMHQYISFTFTISTELHRLIAEAQALLLILNTLSDHLDVINGIAARDTAATQLSKDEILGHLWTMLGGNRKSLRSFDTELALLNRVGQYQQLAVAHVSRAIVKLQGIGAELETLNEQVGSSDLVGEALPLAMHLEQVHASIASLERARGEGKMVEAQQMNRALDAGDGVAVNPLGWKSTGKEIGR